MSLTPSNMMPLGTTAPDFNLPDAISGDTLSLQQLKSDSATVIMFICNHCPFVKHIQSQLTQLANDYQSKKVQFIAINSNDTTTYPDDSPDNMKLIAEQNNYPFPYLFDETQDVAKAYMAACTPDFYIFDSQLKCVYRGQLDNSRPGNDKAVTGKDIRSALDAIIKGQAVLESQTPSQGCNIKWKATI